MHPEGAYVSARSEITRRYDVNPRATSVRSASGIHVIVIIAGSGQAEIRAVEQCAVHEQASIHVKFCSRRRDPDAFVAVAFNGHVNTISTTQIQISYSKDAKIS